MFNIQIQLFTLQVQEMKDTHIARFKIVHLLAVPAITLNLFYLFCYYVIRYDQQYGGENGLGNCQITQEFR